MDGGRIRRGWHLAKLSWNVVQSDRRLLVLPVLQCVAGIAAAAAFFVPAVHFGRADGSNLLLFGALAVWTFPATFISAFFGVAFVSVAKRRLSGERATVRVGLALACRRSRQIAGWALAVTLLGLAIQALQQVKVGFIAVRIAEWLLEATWAIATFFVVPIMALEGLGPIAATRRSSRVIRERWGDGVTGVVSIGAAFALLELPVVILGAIGFVSYHDSHAFGIVVLAIAGVLFLLVSSARSAVQQLFHLELYSFAATGAPFGVYPEDLGQAFERQGIKGSEVAKSVGTLDASAVVDSELSRARTSEIEETRTHLVDELHRVGLVDRSGLRIRPVRMFVDDEGNVGVVLDNRYGERWSGLAADAFARLRSIPAGAGEDRFWLAFRT